VPRVGDAFPDTPETEKKGILRYCLWDSQKGFLPKPFSRKKELLKMRKSFFFFFLNLVFNKKVALKIPSLPEVLFSDKKSKIVFLCFFQT